MFRDGVFPGEIKPQLYSIGYEGKDLSSYIDELKRNKITCIVDVRKNAISRKKGFSKSALRNGLDLEGIKYYHIPDLGIDSSLRKGLDTPDDYRTLFIHYKNLILPNQMPSLDYLQRLIVENGRLALTCFEKDNKSCHRTCITNYLDNSGVFGKTIHL